MLTMYVEDFLTSPSELSNIPLTLIPTKLVNGGETLTQTTSRSLKLPLSQTKGCGSIDKSKMKPNYNLKEQKYNIYQSESHSWYFDIE